jgi:hypothetical protein
VKYRLLMPELPGVHTPASVGYIFRELIIGYVPQKRIAKKEHWEKHSESRAEHGS